MEEKAFSAFYNEYYEAVFRYLYVRLPSFEESEDLAAEAFSALWQNFANVREETRKQWLFSVARNKLMDHLRQKYRMDLIWSNQEIDNTTLSELIDMTSGYTNILTKLVDRLNPEYKELYELRYHSQFSFGQIASKLGISENNAKVRHNRLIKQLQKLWQQE